MEVQAEFRVAQGLQEPERSILAILKPLLSNARVLDIGVGGGRTTPFFAGALDYVGIDYSPGMIRICKEKYSEVPNTNFLICDARELHFIDTTFDIVLFSFNGIDNMPHLGRLKALSEIHRICKPMGSFAFSSHNLLYAPLLLGRLRVRPSHRRPPGVASIFRDIVTNAKRRKLNPNWQALIKDEYACIVDGAANWKINSYYVNPGYQVKQLRDAGFSNVRIFSLNGKEVVGQRAIEGNRDPWLYFLCSPI